ncbi:hypothetical protein NDU88_002328 [Pleurodeles waltl]|uniref:Uncharacterized protein n=1 Tax=Pleurodeles waltl TaxID=8319 RepID=A0AAV7M5N8_PLEWA|nr:hypothetical protein NDU88_002328 [Pleurodeles waltl]
MWRASPCSSVRGPPRPRTTPGAVHAASACRLLPEGRVPLTQSDAGRRCAQRHRGRPRRRSPEAVPRVGEASLCAAAPPDPKDRNPELLGASVPSGGGTTPGTEPHRTRGRPCRRPWRGVPSGEGKSEPAIAAEDARPGERGGWPLGGRRSRRQVTLGLACSQGGRGRAPGSRRPVHGPSRGRGGPGRWSPRTRAPPGYWGDHAAHRFPAGDRAPLWGPGVRRPECQRRTADRKLPPSGDRPSVLRLGCGASGRPHPRPRTGAKETKSQEVRRGGRGPRQQVNPRPETPGLAVGRGPGRLVDTKRAAALQSEEHRGGDWGAPLPWDSGGAVPGIWRVWGLERPGAPRSHNQRENGGLNSPQGGLRRTPRPPEEERPPRRGATTKRPPLTSGFWYDKFDPGGQRDWRGPIPGRPSG